MAEIFNLHGKRILVFGGTSGIGFGIARLAAELGGKTTVASRSRDKVARATREIGRGTEGHAIDLTVHEAVRSYFEEREPFDHVVVSAAELVAGPVRTTGISEARRAMDSKFWSAYHVAREARIGPGGSLTFISGVLSRRPSPAATLLGAINAALEALAQGLALELAPVRVNAVSPGRTDTAWWDGLPPDERKALLDRSAAALPVRRVGRPEDIAKQAILFMLNDFMTGSVVAVDGGGSIA